MYVVSKDLGDQNLVFWILKPPYIFCCVVFALQENLCLVLILFCKMYSTWILGLVLGNRFLCR
jgi:hypothetical protein